MGLLDGLRSILGFRAEADAGRDADPEDLFGMSTAYLTMAAELGYEAADEGALCFGDVDSADFREALTDVEAILAAGREETGTEFSVATDDHGYRWVIFEEADPEDLVTSMHFAADTFVEHGYGSRLLAAVFAFEPDEALGRGGTRTDGSEADGPVYWIYSFRRGAYYPFAPRAGHDRDSTVEFRLESALDGELAVEPEREYWYPLWPSASGRHPWE